MKGAMKNDEHNTAKTKIAIHVLIVPLEIFTVLLGAPTMVSGVLAVLVAVLTGISRVLVVFPSLGITSLRIIRQAYRVRLCSSRSIRQLKRRLIQAPLQRAFSQRQHAFRQCQQALSRQCQ